MPTIATLQRRFDAFSNQKPDSCWTWTGSSRGPTGNKRPCLWVPELRQYLNAYRLSWMLRHGAWPSGVIMHRCDNGLRVNPAHLEEGDQGKNMRDAFARSRLEGHRRITMVRTQDGWEWTSPAAVVEVYRTSSAMVLAVVPVAGTTGRASTREHPSEESTPIA